MSAAPSFFVVVAALAVLSNNFVFTEAVSGSRADVDSELQHGDDSSAFLELLETSKKASKQQEASASNEKFFRFRAPRIRLCPTSGWTCLPWGFCNKRCDGGGQSRTCTRTANCGIETKVEHQTCNNQKCCTPTSWGAWTACSKKCAGGQQTSSRKIPIAKVRGMTVLAKPSETFLYFVKACYSEPDIRLTLWFPRLSNHLDSSLWA